MRGAALILVVILGTASCSDAGAGDDLGTYGGDPASPEYSSPSTGGDGCTSGYSPCLPPASDYDCSGGTGDGPEYTGYVTVTGSDPYGLDADGDGAGCE